MKKHVTNQDRAQDLTQGPIGKSIAHFALPYMLAYFLQVLYGLADMTIIGHYCGVEATTAVANGAQVMHMFTVVAIAISVGGTVCIAKATGARDAAAQSRYAGATLTSFAALGAVATVLLLAFCQDIVAAMDTPAEAVAATEDYLNICFAGAPFIVIYNVLASIFRGLGDTRRPMCFVAAACAANIGLDLLFIGHMGLGPSGAALGTTLSQAISVLLAVISIRQGRAGLELRRDHLRVDRRAMGEIFRIGTPVALQDGFIQLSFMLIMVIANGRGVTDAAAVGIVEKFIGILFIVPSAMLATTSTMAAQCLGAGMRPRAEATLRSTLAIAVAFGVSASAAISAAPEAAVSLFTADAAVVASGAEYLRGYVWDCLLAGIHFCFSGYFTACGLSIISFAHNFAAIVLARLPLAYAASAMFPSSLFPMGMATCTGSLLSDAICVAVFIILRRKGRI